MEFRGDFVFFDAVVSSGAVSDEQFIVKDTEQIILDVSGTESTANLLIEGKQNNEWHPLAAIDMESYDVHETIAADGFYAVGLDGINYLRITAQTAPSGQLTVRGVSGG